MDIYPIGIAIPVVNFWTLYIGLFAYILKFLILYVVTASWKMKEGLLHTNKYYVPHPKQMDGILTQQLITFNECCQLLL